MIDISKAELLHSVQRALLFNITSTMRFISLELSTDTLKMLVYFEKEPTELERDLIYSVAGEVCGDFPGLDDCDVKLQVDIRKYDELQNLELLAYAKYDGDEDY